jgi:hypothetical protein
MRRVKQALKGLVHELVGWLVVGSSETFPLL